MAAPPEVVAHKPHFHRNAPLKEPVRVATTTAGTLASSFENGDTVDGVTLATGDRILIKNQSSGAENGIYVVAASGAPARAYDMDVAAEFVGTLVYVVEGTTNGGTIWRCTNTSAPTVGTTAITFSAFSAGASTLDDLSDVNAPSPADGDRLTWDDGSGEWVPAPATTVTASAISALGFVGPLLISDTPSTPLVFADLIQNEAQDDLVYADL